MQDHYKLSDNSMEPLRKKVQRVMKLLPLIVLLAACNTPDARQEAADHCVDTGKRLTVVIYPETGRTRITCGGEVTP